MRITESQLRSIIKEEQRRLFLERVIREVAEELQTMFQQSGAAEALGNVIDQLVDKGIEPDEIEDAINNAMSLSIDKMIQHSMRGKGDLQRGPGGNQAQMR